MARRIARRDFDALVAYQATASILVGAIGWLCGCPLRIVHQTCTPDETAWPVRLADKIAGALGLYTLNIINSASTHVEFDAYPAKYRRSMQLIEHQAACAPASTVPRTLRGSIFNDEMSWSSARLPASPGL